MKFEWDEKRIMKKHYDFFKGEKGKFFIPKNEIELPVYLNQTNQEYYLNLATNKNIALSELINTILAKDKSFLNLVKSE
jgi:hypothetical protein